MFNKMMLIKALYAILLMMILSSVSCTNYGPKTLNKDQLDYGRSIGDTWKNQMLVNLVKLRYIDMPVFVDVGQIVSGYSIETSLQGIAGFNNNFLGVDSQSIGVEGKYTDRPTITYTPKTGEDYLRSILEPVEPRALLTLILTGYDADLLLTWAVESINGIKNYTTSKSDTLTPDPRFIEFVHLMSNLQQAGSIGFEVENDPNTQHDIFFILRNRNLDDRARDKRRRARELLGIDANVNKFRVLYSPFAIDDDVIAIQTRSILQMLIAMAGFVDVPPDKASRALPGYIISPGMPRPFRVYTSQTKPESAFASVKYYDDWYWIEHDDLASKEVFTLMLFLTTLTNRVDTENTPVLSIPTN
jgi:hypothetical protein